MSGYKCNRCDSFTALTDNPRCDCDEREDSLVTERDQLRAEVERLRESVDAADARMIGVLDGTFCLGQEADQLRADLAAVTAARDEACELALYAAELESCPAKFIGQDFRDSIAELRAVGRTKGTP